MICFTCMKNMRGLPLRFGHWSSLNTSKILSVGISPSLVNITCCRSFLSGSKYLDNGNSAPWELMTHTKQSYSSVIDLFISERVLFQTNKHGFSIPFSFFIFWVVSNVKVLYMRGRRGHDRMVVGFTTTCAIGAYHH
jgi:hypothetical protein